MAAAPAPCPARSRRTGIVSTISATVTVCRSQLMTTPPPGHEEETPPASRAGADHGPYTGSGVVSLVPGCVSSARADRDAGLCGLVGAAWPRAAHLGVPARLARTGRSSRPCRRTAHRFDGLYWSRLTLLAW